MSMKAFFLDTTKCTGCRSCQSACKSWNALPYEPETVSGDQELTAPSRLSAITWTRVRFDRFDGNASSWSIIHEKCNHCASPECLKICPEKAIYKNDGWTVIDHDRCIGCGACEKACPYAAVHVMREKRAGMKSFKAYKCHGCIPTGLDVPACASACPTGALIFGQRMKLIQAALKRVKALKKLFPDAGVYGLEPWGGLNVITVLKDIRTADTMSRPITGMQEDILGSKLLYFCLRPMMCGVDSLKRKAWIISSSLSDRKKGV